MSDTDLSLQDNGLLVEIADVAAWLNLDGQDPDAWLESAVQAANSAVLNWLGWDPRSLTVTDLFDGRGGNSLVVIGRPITAINAVNFIYGSFPVPNIVAQVPSMFYADPRAPIIYSQCGFPRGKANIQVTYTRGYAQLPGAITQGMFYTIKAMLDASGVDFNATGESYSGVLSQTFWPSGPGTVPPSAQTIMQRYRQELYA